MSALKVNGEVKLKAIRIHSSSEMEGEMRNRGQILRLKGFHCLGAKHQDLTRGQGDLP